MVQNAEELQSRTWGVSDAIQLDIAAEPGTIIIVNVDERSRSFASGDVMDISNMMLTGINHVDIGYAPEDESADAAAGDAGVSLDVNCDFVMPSAQLNPTTITQNTSGLSVELLGDESYVDMGLFVDGERVWHSENVQETASIDNPGQYEIKASSEVFVQVSDPAGNTIKLPVQYLDLMPLRIEEVDGSEQRGISVQGTAGKTIEVFVNDQSMRCYTGEMIDISEVLRLGENVIRAEYVLDDTVSSNVIEETSAEISITVEGGLNPQIEVNPPRITEDTQQITVTTHNIPGRYGVFMYVNGYEEYQNPDVGSEEVVIDDLAQRGVTPSSNISIVINDYEHQPIELALQKIQVKFFYVAGNQADIQGWVFCSQADLPDGSNIVASLVDASGNRHACSLDTQTQNLDEAVSESGLQVLLGSYFDRAYKISGIGYPADIVAGDYTLEVICMLENGEQWAFNMGTVTMG